MTVERMLARFAHSDIPTQPRDIAKLCLFDWLVCGIAGKQEPIAQKLVEKAVSEGGQGQATLFGGGTVPAAQAALVNGATAHALDYDDTHFAHIGHTSVVIISTALAIAEKTNASRDEFLNSIIVGSEAAVRIGIFFGRTHYQQGFHQTATSGAFGAVLAASRLLKLTEDQTITALGLCASRAGGLKAQFGTMAKPLNAGLAAETGVQSALWTQGGITATFEGLSAFDEAFQTEGNAAAFEHLGQEWHFENVSHKFHACCHGLHAMLEALAPMSIDPNQISRIVVRTNPRWMSVCNIHDPKTGLEAKFSYRATAAMALSGIDTASIASFSKATLGVSGVRSLIPLVHVSEDYRISETECRVEVSMLDGKIHETEFDLVSPQSIEIRAEKLRQKAKSVLGEARSNAIWQAVQSDDFESILLTVAS